MVCRSSGSVIPLPGTGIASANCAICDMWSGNTRRGTHARARVMAPRRRKALLVAVWTANVLIALYAKTGALLSVARLLCKLLLVYLLLCACTLTGSLLLTLHRMGMLPGQSNFGCGPWAAWRAARFPREHQP